MSKKITGLKVIKAGSNPDVDSDFSTEIRDKAIEHVTELYGKDNVANIITYNTLAAKSAFKEMCTIYQIPFAKANQITALIPKPVEGKDVTLSEIFDPTHERYSEGADFRAAVSDDYWKDVLKGAIEIEGRTKSVGMHPCFTAGTMVITDNGYKEIEKITKGDLVLTHLNRFQKVIEIQKNISNDIYKLRTPNSLPLFTTGNHPFYIIETKKHQGKRIISENPIWKNVKDLDVKNDYVGIPINTNSVIPNFPNLPIEESDFWWLVGRFLADGWVDDYHINVPKIKKNEKNHLYDKNIKNIIISVGKNNGDKEKLFSLVKKYFYHTISDEKETYKIYISVSKSPELFLFLKNFGNYANGKKIPLFVEDLPKYLLRYFVEGYLSANGDREKKTNKYFFSAVSKNLFLGMIRCINKVYSNSCNVVINYRENYSKIQGRTVSNKDRYMGYFIKEKREKSRSFIKDNYLWVHITELIKIENKNETVYNLSVIDDNSYMANNLTVHNCGVLFSSKPLQEVLPLYVRQEDNRVMTQWTYGACEELGLIKMDFLGLDTVDLIQHTLENIKKNGKTPPNMLDFIHGPMNDKKTFDLIKAGKTMGIFQFSSSEMQDLLVRMQAREFEDLVAANALYRPGPMASNAHLMYADRRAGREKSKQTINPEFDGTILEDILAKTQNLIIFQEQIMQISNQIAGMTLQEGDELRSAMGKKKKEKMDKMKPIFIKGGMENGYSEKAMTDLWNTMEPFAKYAFNKCLDGNTNVYLEDGTSIRIRDLYKIFDNTKIIKINSMFETGEIKPNIVKNIVQSGRKPLWKIITESGHRIRITEDHRMLINNSNPTKDESYGTIKDKGIIVGGHLFNKFGELDKIIEIIPPKKDKNGEYYNEMTYDIEMDTSGPANFVANGLISHNSHSVAYSMNAIQAAYLKAHYPVEFISALISQSLDKKDKVLAYLKEAREMGLIIDTVDINKSNIKVSPNYKKENPKDADILYGFSGVKAVSTSTADEIIKEREANGDFTSVQDFITRCQQANIGNKRVYQNLALSGAFDVFGVSRKGIVENIDSLIREGKNKKEKGASLFDMFDDTETDSTDLDLAAFDEYDWVEKLKLEADTIGLFLTGHPLENMGTGLSNLATTTIKKILDTNENVVATLPISIIDIKRKSTKRGKIVQVSIDDGTGYLDARLAQPIIKGIDKKNAIEKIKTLYINGDSNIPNEYPKLVSSLEIVPYNDIEKNSVYLATISYRRSTEDLPYMARIENIRPLTLAKNGMLPIRIRIDDETIGTTMANKMDKALAKNLHEKRKGEYPIYKVRYSKLPVPEIIDVNVLNAIKEMHTTSGQQGKRSWPPKNDITIDENIKPNVNNENKVYTIETLKYEDTGYTASKTVETKQAIEKFLGDEGYDFGAFDETLFE